MRLPSLAPASLPVRILLALLGAACVGGCLPDLYVPDPGVGLEVPVFHRTVPDLVYSAATGRDCSVVWLDRGQSYCRPVEPPVPPQPYCTRSLGWVDCWADPEHMTNLPPQVAQGPHELTPEQNRLRLARWPADLQ